MLCVHRHGRFPQDGENGKNRKSPFEMMRSSQKDFPVYFSALICHMDGSGTVSLSLLFSRYAPCFSFICPKLFHRGNGVPGVKAVPFLQAFDCFFPG